MDGNSILFITTHNLASNPRLVKEIRLAVEQGWDIEVICFHFDNWSAEANQHLLDEFSQVKFHVIPAGKRPVLPWLRSVAAEQCYRLWFSITKKISSRSLAYAVSRRSILLEKKLKEVSKPGWVIGHNPGALWPVYKAKQQFNCKAGFDVEDYHQGEGNRQSLQYMAKKLLGDLLQKMDYASFAAPLFREANMNDLGADGRNWEIILNYFPSQEFPAPSKVNGPLKLVWFSQHVNPGRGLEYILPAIKKMGNKVELHLIGNMNKNFYEVEMSGHKNIIVHGAMPHKQLHEQLKHFDIGLALENASDLNREYCITNKLICYLQAGLYVLASKTRGQEQFIGKFSNHGIIFNNSEKAFEEALENALNNTESIRLENLSRYNNFQEHNWERESQKLLRFWNS